VEILLGNISTLNFKSALVRAGPREEKIECLRKSARIEPAAAKPL